jgi:hypothetical protein
MAKLVKMVVDAYFLVDDDVEVDCGERFLQKGDIIIEPVVALEVDNGITLCTMIPPVLDKDLGMRFDNGDCIKMECPPDEFPYNIKEGDKITWHDPDGGICTKTGIIKSIEWSFADNCAAIVFESGDYFEAFSHELSPAGNSQQNLGV